MNDVVIGAVIEILSDVFGLQVRKSWHDQLRRKLPPLCKRLGLCAEELLKTLRKDTSLQREIAGVLSVDESYFFRHPEHFSFLAGHLGKLLADRVPQGKHIIWSAGCAKGEEPYSIAITLCNALTPEQRFCVDILGSDLSSPCLDIAESGQYARWSLREMPKWIEAKYFSQVTGKIVVSEQIRKMVRFNHLSIAEHLRLMPLASVDVLFFRNVAIYLTGDTIRDLYALFANVLRDEGILIVAPSDPRPSIEELVSVGDEGATIFQRRRRSAIAGLHPSPEPLKSGQAEPPGLWLTSPASSLQPPACDMPSEVASLREADAMILSDPSMKSGYFIRAQLHLSEGMLDEAIEDLRRAIFIDGSDRVVRYFYALALLQAGMTEQVKRQLSELQHQLGRISPDSLLEDGETSASELLDEIESIMESTR